MKRGICKIGLLAFLTRRQNSMLFYLSPGIGPAIEAPGRSADLVNALQHLADSRRCGLNNILGDRSVLRAVSTCEDLSKSARAVYARLAEVSTQLHGIISKCNVYVEVSEQPAVCHRVNVAGQIKIVISVDYIA